MDGHRISVEELIGNLVKKGNVGDMRRKTMAQIREKMSFVLAYRHLVTLLVVIAMGVFLVNFVSGGESTNLDRGFSSGSDTQQLQKLIDALTSPSLEHSDKWNAVQLIRQYGQKATPGLLSIIEGEDRGDGHYYAIRAMGYIGDSTSTGTLCKVLLNRNYGGRRYAAIALGQIGDPCAAEALGKALEDVEYVRTDAIDALARISSDKSRAILADYHFGGATRELKMRASCDKASYLLGDTIRVNSVLVNDCEKSVFIGGGPDEPLGYIVVQRGNGDFVQEIDTGLREGDRVAGSAPTMRELKPGENLTSSVVGQVEMWTLGEKEDHAFVPSPPFLTLNFRSRAFHIRKSGEYQVRLVFKQDNDLVRKLRAMGISEDKAGLLWQGKVVSNAVSFSVADDLHTKDKASPNTTKGGKSEKPAEPNELQGAQKLKQ